MWNNNTRSNPFPPKTPTVDDRVDVNETHNYIDATKKFHIFQSSIDLLSHKTIERKKKKKKKEIDWQKTKL